MKKRARFEAAVNAEVERREALRPVTVRTLTICFKDKTVSFDGAAPIVVSADCLSIPILSTDRPVFS